METYGYEKDAPSEGLFCQYVSRGRAKKEDSLVRQNSNLIKTFQLRESIAKLQMVEGCVVGGRNISLRSYDGTTGGSFGFMFGFNFQ